MKAIERRKGINGSSSSPASAIFGRLIYDSFKLKQFLLMLTEKEEMEECSFWRGASLPSIWRRRRRG